MNKEERIKRRKKFGIKRFKLHHGYNPKSQSDKLDEMLSNSDRYIGMLGTTGKLCSCYMCGNKRRNNQGKEKLTLQEIRSELSSNEQISEMEG